MFIHAARFFSPADALPGVLRWQARLWQLVSKLRGARQLGPPPDPSLLRKKETAEARRIWQNRNYAVQQVNHHHHHHAALTVELSYRRWPLGVTDVQLSNVQLSNVSRFWPVFDAPVSSRVFCAVVFISG